MSSTNDPTANLRRSVYLLMTAAAVAIAAAKTVGAENVVEPSRYKAPAPDGYGLEPDRKWPGSRPEPSPTFSSNDRSRWATVKALVENGTYVIGQREDDPDSPPKTSADYVAYAAERKKSAPTTPVGKRDTGIVFDPAYATLDKVMNPDTGQFFSSKPPLMPTVFAGGYWALNRACGWHIDRDRWLVVPTLLLLANVLPFAAYLVLLSRLIDATGRTDFGRLLAFAAACFGTFLITFSATMNNHTPAAFAVLFAVYPLLRAMAENRDMEPGEWLCCGFFAGLAATLELPAAAFLAGIGLPLLIARPKRTLLYFVPMALIPLVADRALNFVALGELSPAYEKFGGPWYEYEGSHWLKLKLPPDHPSRKGIDFADESKDVYGFHLLFGHHGWFSLTPVWFLAALGLVALGVRSAADLKGLRRGRGSPWTPALFAGMTLAVSAVVIGFYIVKTNNYGGNTSGPRWLFWLTPLWLLAIPSAADRLAASRGGRGLCAVLLAFSVFSAFYPAWNPWRPPWIQQLLEFKGWLRY